jgi:hypothetical protein
VKRACETRHSSQLTPPSGYDPIARRIPRNATDIYALGPDACVMSLSSQSCCFLIMRMLAKISGKQFAFKNCMALIFSIATFDFLADTMCLGLAMVCCVSLATPCTRPNFRRAHGISCVIECKKLISSPMDCKFVISCFVIEITCASYSM